MDCLHNPLAKGESAKIWRAEDLGDLEMLHARYLTYSFAKHTHEGAAIGVIEDGAESFYYRGAIHTAPAGQIVVFNPNEPHTGQGANEHGWRFRMFYLDSRLLQRAAAEMAGKVCDIPFFATPIIQDVELAGMLRNLHKSLEAGGSDIERQSKFIWTFAHLARRHADSSPSERAVGSEKAVVKLVREYLEDHFADNVSLDQIAVLSGLSSYHLIRVFRSEVGLPPHAYLEQVRINRARQLLRAGNSIAEVAYTTGFTDQSHFSRHFKKMTGVTPGQYQRTAITYKTTPATKAQAHSR
ncbi:MAG: AraC family transcriptional regulator [Acidobacteriaceae bacterium]